MPQPVAAFLHHSLILKAALADCLDDPDPKAVHKLRSTTRRLEAVLEVLNTFTDLPSLTKRSRDFRRSLRKIRRAAGDVRDLDVHRELLSHYQSMVSATELDTDLRKARKKSAKRLQQHIGAEEAEIRHALERLDIVFAQIPKLNLSGRRLIHITKGWLAPALRNLDSHHDEDLHSIRKACKTARYMAEIGSEASEAVAKLAKRLNGVQQTTGAWHDYLLLLSRAQASLPDESPFIERLYAKTNRLRKQAESKAARLLKA
jgi:CHAD domain-containing protein